MGIYTTEKHPANELTIRLKEYQSKHDLDRFELAAKIGMSHSSFSRLEMNDLSLSESTYKKIAKVLDISTFEAMRLRHNETDQQ